MRPSGTLGLRLGRWSWLWRPRSLLVCLALLLACGVLAVLLLGTGTIRLAPGQVLAGLLGGADDPTITRVVQRIRLPRLLTALLVGAALGVSGAVFQSLSRNALGSPDVIGFTTGAATGAITAIILFGAGALATALGAVGSGLVTALIVLLLARQGGGYRLILIGIGVGTVLSGVNTLLMVMSHVDMAMSAQIWLAGSLAARSWPHVWTAAAGLALFAPPVLIAARQLLLLEMGDDMAAQLGLRVGRARMVLVLAAVGLSSVATACTGPIAFIALAGPQIARRLTRTPGVPLVSGALAGAALLLAADMISQNPPWNLTAPIGLTTGFLGGLYLILLIARDGRP